MLHVVLCSLKRVEKGGGGKLNSLQNNEGAMKRKCNQSLQVKSIRGMLQLQNHIIFVDNDNAFMSND